MTPREKAEELFDKMSTNNGDEYHHCTYYVAKQCALIAVDEILESNPNYPEFKENEGTAIRFWELVKQEIQKL
jgi:hypothetical protein